jgi:hypothetical protein
MFGIRVRGCGVVAAFLTLTLGLGERASAQVVVAVNKSTQRMTVYVDGAERYSWTVSTGLGGGPHAGSYRPQRLERSWHSRKYHYAPMPYSIFFDGNYAIHGTTHVRQLGRRASKGCVRLHPANAAVLFDLVRTKGKANTRIVIANTAYALAPAEKPGAEPSTPPELKPGIGQAAVLPAAGEPAAAPAEKIDIATPVLETTAPAAERSVIRADD